MNKKNEFSAINSRLDAQIEPTDYVSSDELSVAAAKPTFSTENITVQLTTSWSDNDTFQRKWTAESVTFGINTTSPTNSSWISYFFEPSESSGLTGMSALQVATAQLSFQLWDDLIPLSLVESGGANANITFNYSSSTDIHIDNDKVVYETYARPFLTYKNTWNEIRAEQIWLATSWESNNDFGMKNGGYGFMTMIHEIGHSLGLSHTGIYNAGNGGTITYDANAVFAQDNRQNTIMSYFGYYDTATSTWTQDGTQLSGKYPQTPMIYDIAAIQSLYGADTTTRTGDTVYGYNSTFAANYREKPILDFSTNTNPIFTIWDAGGNDTLDCSGWNGNQTIDLSSGSYSSVCGLTNNIGIAFGTTIENAIGGTGNDIIIGNSASNTLDGWTGGDFLIGDLGNDQYLFGSGYGIDTIQDTADVTTTNLDSVIMGTGILPNAVTVTRTASQMILTLNAKDQLHIDWNTANGTGIEQVIFVDGTKWNTSTLINLSNHAPTVTNALTNQITSTGSAFSFTIPTTTFDDIDKVIWGDSLNYTASLANNSALPTWLSFNSNTRTFSGTPDAGSTGILNLKVTATDSVGASTSSNFALTIANLATGDGIVTTGFGFNDFGQSVAVQADGKLVVAGYGFSNNGDFSLVRYNSNGSLDTTFDGDGKVITAFSSSDDLGKSVAIQSDGKILVAGYSDNSNRDFALARYNSNGSLDTSFDYDGKVSTDFGSSDEGCSVAIQTDGKILVAGSNFTNISNRGNFALARYNINGSLDTSFDGDGKVTTVTNSATDDGHSVAIQADGKILVASSSFLTGSNTRTNFALVRYNNNGSLDTSFDSDGKVTTTISNYSDFAYAITMQTNGKILVAGYASNGSNDDFILVRYNSNGSLDTSFDSDGKVMTNISGSSNDWCISVTVQTDGKILMAGTSNNGSNNDIALVRYNANGSLDSSFGSNGKVITVISHNDFGYSVTVQADGKILVAGFSSNGNDYDFALVRYNSNGTLDTTFDTTTAVAVNSSPYHSITDFNGDGKSDLFWHNTDGSIYAMTLNGTSIAGGSVIYGGLPVEWQTLSTRGDYNADGKTDVLLWNTNTHSAYIIQMNGATIGSESYVSYAQNLPTGWAVADSTADYNNDGKSDLLWWNSDSSTAYLALHDGSAALSAAQLFGGITGWTIQSAGGDYNGDGNSDILFWNASSSSLYMTTMNGTTISSQGMIAGGLTGWSIADAKGNYNADGKSDILWRNAASGEIWEYQMNGTTISSSTSVGTVSTAWQIVSAHNDFNADGKADILWKNSDGSAGISLADTPTAITNLGAFAGWTVQHADNDVNADGKADVLWTHTDGAVYLMEMDGVSLIGGGQLGAYSGWSALNV